MTLIKIIPATALGLFLIYHPFPQSHLLLFLGLSVPVLFLRPKLTLTFHPNLLIALGLLSMIGFALFPLFNRPKIGNFQFVSMPGADDYYKHLYVLTAINTKGLPPIHPYAPDNNFSYYYGYYLIPAAVAKVFSFPYTKVIYGYVLLTTAVCLLVIHRLVTEFFPSKRWQFLAFGLLVIGSGWDIIPTLIHFPLSAFTHVEFWSFELLGQSIDNTSTMFLWVPQHIMAATLAIWLLTHAREYVRKQKWATALILWYVAISSAFVALSLLAWLGWLALTQKFVKRLIWVGLVPLSLLLPYVLTLGNRSQLLSPGRLVAFPFTGNWYLDLALTLLCEYGLPVVMVIFGLLRRSVRKEAVPILVILGLGLAIRSRGYNDFSMRFIIPAQFGLTLLAVSVVSGIKRPDLKTLLAILLAVNLLVTSAGWAFETAGRWKHRQIFHPEFSALLTGLAKNQTCNNLLIASREDWSWYIPPLVQKPIYTPFLYDALVYFIPDQPRNITRFTTAAEQLANPPSQSTAAEFAQNYNQIIRQFTPLLTETDYDCLLINQRIWVKLGRNPWFEIYKAHLPAKAFTPVTAEYSLVTKQALVEFITKNQYQLGPAQTITVGKTMVLPAGVQLLAACKADSNGSRVRLELEDYFAVFDRDIPDTAAGCTGAMFFNPDKIPLRISGNTTISRLYSFPLETGVK